MTKRRTRAVESLVFQPLQDPAHLRNAADALAVVTRGPHTNLFSAMRAHPRRWATLVSTAAAATPFVTIDFVAAVERHLSAELVTFGRADDLRYPPAAFAAAFELGRAIERRRAARKPRKAAHRG